MNPYKPNQRDPWDGPSDTTVILAVITIAFVTGFVVGFSFFSTELMDTIEGLSFYE